MDDSRVKSISDQIKHILQQPYFSELDYSISVDELINASKSLKNNKSAGLDQISNEMIKCSLPFLSRVFKNIFNASLCNQ